MSVSVVPYLFRHKRDLICWCSSVGSIFSVRCLWQMKDGENGAAVEKYEPAKYFSGTARVKRIKSAGHSLPVKRQRSDQNIDLQKHFHNQANIYISQKVSHKQIC